MIQVWTINILVMPSRGRTEKSKNGQKLYRKKPPKDQNQGGQNPQKWENILRLQQSTCMIPWSHDTGVDNQHSRHAITWPDREKQKWTKAPQDESPKGSESRWTKPPKTRKYFKTPTIKVYDPMITWYRCGQSTFSSCHHVASQRKAKMDKKTIVRNPQIIRIKVDKTPKMRKYFKTPTIKVYDAMITWYRCGQSTFSSCHHVAWQRKAKMDKSTTGRKPQRIRIKADKTPKNEKIF